MEAEGIVEKPDVVGAVFGQTEGLLGEELDLRDLQKGGRIGRIEVDVQSKKGRSEGMILIPSSLDQVETSILAAALETIDRVGDDYRLEVKILPDRAGDAKTELGLAREIGSILNRPLKNPALAYVKNPAIEFTT